MFMSMISWMDCARSDYSLPLFQGNFPSSRIHWESFDMSIGCRRLWHINKSSLPLSAQSYVMLFVVVNWSSRSFVVLASFAHSKAFLKFHWRIRNCVWVKELAVPERREVPFPWGCETWERSHGWRRSKADVKPRAALWMFSLLIPLKLCSILRRTHISHHMSNAPWNF
jgi:hypothetical protein